MMITVYRSVCTVPVIVGRYDNNCIGLYVQCRLLLADMIVTVYRSVCTVPVIVGTYDNNCISVCMYSAGYWWQI
jgi:hypothetical protein